jgi:hypothetical protein
MVVENSVKVVYYILQTIRAKTKTKIEEATYFSSHVLPEISNVFHMISKKIKREGLYVVKQVRMCRR